MEKMTRKEEMQQQIKELQEELDNIKEWPLPYETEHWARSLSNCHYYDSQFSPYGINQALTKERCEQLYQKQRLMQDMYLWVDTFCADWEPEWSNEYQHKHGLVDSSDGVKAERLRVKNRFIFGISVGTEKLANQMLEEFKDRINEWY